MPVFLCFSVIIFTLLPLASCKSVPAFFSPPTLAGQAFSCTLDITQDSKKLKALLTRPNSAAYIFEILEPSGLAGLKITVNEQGITAEYLGITLLQEIPGSSFASACQSALQNAELGEKPQKKGGEMLYTGQCAAGNYTVVLNADSQLLAVDVPGLSLSMKASDFKLI